MPPDSDPAVNGHYWLHFFLGCIPFVFLFLLYVSNLRVVMS